MTQFAVGMRGVHSVRVEPQHTAHELGNVGVPVLATPMLILFCEIAGHDAIYRRFKPGEGSVGYHNDLWHLAATPVGGTVTVEATIREIDRKRLIFDVTGHDERAQVVRGTHERIVVDLDKFLAKLREQHK
jgi:predicted thioesterase